MIERLTSLGWFGFVVLLLIIFVLGMIAGGNTMTVYRAANMYDQTPDIRCICVGRP